jgi:hypothetical protein
MIYIFTKCRLDRVNEHKVPPFGSDAQRQIARLHNLRLTLDRIQPERSYPRKYYQRIPKYRSSHNMAGELAETINDLVDHLQEIAEPADVLIFPARQAGLLQTSTSAG